MAPEIDRLAETQKDLRRKTHETIDKVSDDYGRQYLQYRHCSSDGLLNDVAKFTLTDSQSMLYAMKH